MTNAELIAQVKAHKGKIEVYVAAIGQYVRVYRTDLLTQLEDNSDHDEDAYVRVMPHGYLVIG